MSRKTRPVPRRGDRAFEWDAASRVEVGLARRSIVERLVWPDAVVDVAEAGGLHRERAAVVARGAVEVLVLQRAEESLDDAVGLRAPDAGPDVAQQRLIAGERRLVGLAAKARAVVGDDGDRSGEESDELAGVLVDQFAFATVVPQVVQAENAFGLVDGRVETGERIDAAARRGDPGGEAVLGGVVDDRADAPDPTARCFELAEVGLPDPIAFGRRVVEHLAAQRRPGLAISPKTPRQQQPTAAQGPLDRRGGRLMAVGAHHRGDLAVAPRRPVGRVLRRQGLGRINGRRRPRPLHRRVAASERGQAAVVGALRNAGQGGEPRDRQLGCRSQGLEVGEGTRSTYSEPFCQIRSCTVASASASFSSWISARCRRSTRLPRLPALPGMPSSIAALPASTNRLRHRLIDSADTPCLRAASATVISWASTASTSCSRVSTGTGSLLLLKIELPVTDQPRNPARKSDAHQVARPEHTFGVGGPTGPLGLPEFTTPVAV